MSLDDYWQENKRFVFGVLAGVILFFIGTGLIDSVYGEELRATRSTIARTQRKLKDPLYNSGDRAQAQEENDRLKEAFERLVRSTRFVPQARFQLDPNLGSPANQYRRAFARVLEEISTRSNRANMQFDPTLGMPKLSPTRENEIIRYLEALDLVEEVLEYSILAGMDRVDRIQCRLDPGLNSRTGLERVERTRVTFTLTGTSLAITRILAWSQRSPHDPAVDPRRGRSLVIEDVEVVPARGKRDEVRADVTFLVVRLAEASDADFQEA